MLRIGVANEGGDYIAVRGHPLLLGILPVFSRYSLSYKYYVDVTYIYRCEYGCIFTYAIVYIQSCLCSVDIYMPF